MSPSAIARATLYRRLVVALAALQVLALVAFHLSLAEASRVWESSMLRLLGGAWAAGLWAAVQRRLALIAIGLSDPHRLEDALEVIGAAALAPVAVVLSYLGSVASAME